ncbi:MAG: FKBP-type peptidyl-prolyl cis-trans isomerase [Bacteroidia bacterium]|nr:FKBP-type peptidyl-prolyl cis-trans isomerase [Bacteroidia bacterium]
MKKIFLLGIAAAVTFSSCKNSKYSGFDESETGLFYQYHNHDEDAKAPSVGDIITLQLVLKNSTTDSVLFDSRKFKNVQKFPMPESKYAGSIEEGFAMLNEGDSATFIVNADSFYKHSSRAPKPKFFKEGDALKFDIKMVKVETQEEYQKQMQKEMAAMASLEAGKIASYVSSKGIKEKPDQNGIYTIITKEGKGATPQDGDSITVHYEGTFLDGQVFDSSLKRKKPIGFRLGRQEVIPGWELAFSKLKKGSKATLIIPSKLAYGDGGGQLPPFATLVFEVELLEINKK